METASDVGSAGEGCTAEREAYNCESAAEVGSIETAVNNGSETIGAPSMDGAAGASAAGASVAAGDSTAGAPPQAESNKTINRMTMKDFRDMKISFQMNDDNLEITILESISLLMA